MNNIDAHRVASKHLKRVEELKRQGCEVQIVETDAGRVVYKKCPPMDFARMLPWLVVGTLAGLIAIRSKRAAVAPQPVQPAALPSGSTS